jgi:phage tail tape-measure protein
MRRSAQGAVTPTSPTPATPSSPCLATQAASAAPPSGPTARSASGRSLGRLPLLGDSPGPQDTLVATAKKGSNKKLSFKDQRELDTMEETIQKEEAHLLKIEKQIVNRNPKCKVCGENHVATT